MDQSASTKVLSKIVTSDESYLDQAEIYRSNGNWFDALACYEAIVRVQPDNWKMHVAMGDSLINLERWKDAIASYEKSIQINPEFDWAWHNLAVAWGKLGDWEEVEICHQVLRSLKQDFWEVNEHIDLVTEHKAEFHQQKHIDQPQTSSVSSEKEHDDISSVEESSFDYKFYIDYYPDLKALSNSDAQKHWEQFGREEGRFASLTGFLKQYQATPCDIPKDFDYKKYSVLNPDLNSNGISSKWDLIKHWIMYGRHERRKYRLTISDLKKPDNENSSDVRLFGCSSDDNIFSKIAQALEPTITAKSYFPLPSQKLASYVGSPNVSHYRTNSIFYTKDIIRQCMLRRNASVLDIGCGTGRIASPMLHYLNHDAQYIGLDVNEDMIAWCQQNISCRNSSFQFICLPLENNYYYSEDNGKQNSYDLSIFESNQFNLIIALSTFNHLKLEDTLQYLSLISRTLAPGGVAYTTFWIIDEEFFEYQKRTNIHQNLRQVQTGLWYGYQKQSFFAGYSKSLLDKYLRKLNLKIIASSPGSWANKKNSRIYPDYFLITKI